MEQTDSQWMMAAQRGLSRLDGRRSEHALLEWDQPCTSVVKGEGRAVFPSNLFMLSPVFLCIAVLRTLEYDKNGDNARNFVRYGN